MGTTIVEGKKMGGGGGRAVTKVKVGRNSVRVATREQKKGAEGGDNWFRPKRNRGKEKKECDSDPPASGGLRQHRQ